MIAFERAPAALPDGVRVYAVGDVHGCLEQLRALHEQIAADLARRPMAQAVLVHLGDYVDRGPDSAGVLALLGAHGPGGGTMPQGITETVNLLGNHEAMMQAALDHRDPQSVMLWLMNGGRQTLASFGLSPEAEPADWAARLAPEPLGFIRRLSLSYRLGGYAFVHAGIRPGVPLAKQSADDLLWIREPFLKAAIAFEAVIVHGHTPTSAPELRGNRIGIDTGAVMGGRLSCAVLEYGRVGFLSV